MLVDSVWREAYLEGIKVTPIETQEICDGRNVATLSVADIVVINNLKHSWWMILDNLNSPLNISYVKELHQIVGANIIPCAGKIRKQPVRITGTTYQPKIPCENDLINLLNQINNIKNDARQGLIAFAQFAKGQFFRDGNKRVAQLIANKLLINSSSGIFSVPVEEKYNFGKQLTQFYEDDNLDEFVNYLAVECLDEIFLPKNRQFIPTEIRDLMHRERNYNYKWK